MSCLIQVPRALPPANDSAKFDTGVSYLVSFSILLLNISLSEYSICTIKNRVAREDCPGSELLASSKSYHSVTCIILNMLSKANSEILRQAYATSITKGR